jgi:hypothetical protein
MMCPLPKPPVIAGLDGNEAFDVRAGRSMRF